MDAWVDTTELRGVVLGVRHTFAGLSCLFVKSDRAAPRAVVVSNGEDPD